MLLPLVRNESSGGAIFLGGDVFPTRALYAGGKSLAVDAENCRGS